MNQKLGYTHLSGSKSILWGTWGHLEAPATHPCCPIISAAHAFACVRAQVEAAVRRGGKVGGGGPAARPDGIPPCTRAVTVPPAVGCGISCLAGHGLEFCPVCGRTWSLGAPIKPYLFSIPLHALRCGQVFRLKKKSHHTLYHHFITVAVPPHARSGAGAGVCGRARARASGSHLGPLASRRPGGGCSASI